MTAIRLFVAACAACLSLTTATYAEEHPEVLHIHDAYARMSSMSGAVFFIIHNNGTVDDRLIGARTDIAQKAELHTHVEDANGVMSMAEIEGGIALPAGEMHVLERGSDHVMLMGLTADLKDGDTFPLTLIFESGQEVTLEVPVDNARMPGNGMMDDHDAMQGATHDHDAMHDGSTD
jgi:periplasmic copper chaperone A